MRGRDLKFFLIGALLTPGAVWAVTSLPHTFKAGDPIRSAEVNANFSVLKAAADALEAGKQTRVSAKCDDGSSIKQINADGTVACELDDVGSGGQSYTAGIGLVLNGTQFSLADGGVGTAKLTDGAVTGTKFSLPLSLSSGPYPVLKVNATGTPPSIALVAGDSGGNFCAPQLNEKIGICADGTIGLRGGGSPGVTGVSTAGTGGTGVSGAAGANGTGVLGRAGTGVFGQSENRFGVRGRSGNGSFPDPLGGIGVIGESSSTYGVLGVNYAAFGGKGVVGESQGSSGIGVFGSASGNADSRGVQGLSTDGVGVEGNSSTRIGVYGESSSGGTINPPSVPHGVYGVTNSNAVGATGVTGVRTGGGNNGAGVQGFHNGGGQGVYGFSQSGRGVEGSSASGVSAYFSGGGGGSGVCSFNGGAGWSCTSDKNAKENFRAVDTAAVLDALARMPIATWNMRGDRSKTRHLGPTAQDFRAAFGLGEGDKTINSVDAQGVALAAIQGLNRKLEAENQALRVSLARLEARLAQLESQAQATKPTER
jgi:hypothetical protein